MKAVCFSEKGPKSTVNEDAFVALPHLGLFIVADGVGGAPAGEYVSRSVVDFLFDKLNAVEKISQELIVEFIESANEGIYKQSKAAGIGGAASTLVVTWICGDKLIAFHAGDSRAYILSDGVLNQVTVDHTEAVSRADQGLKYLVTRAMGVKEQVQVEVSAVAWKQGDVALACSDGITDVLSDEDILTILTIPNVTNAEKARQLVKMSETRGGRDDKTVVIAF